MNKHDVSAQTSEMAIEVPSEFAPYVNQAIMRLSFIFPNVEFSFCDGKIHTTYHSNLEKIDLQKNIKHTLYREKVYQETLSVRIQIANTLMQ